MYVFPKKVTNIDVSTKNKKYIGRKQDGISYTVHKPKSRICAYPVKVFSFLRKIRESNDIYVSEAAPGTENTTNWGLCTKKL